MSQVIDEDETLVSVPRWSIYPVAAVPKTPASTPAVFDSPSNTPCDVHELIFNDL